MFELPEYVILARQVNASLKGKVIQQGSLGNSPHKFVWYNRSHEAFADLTAAKTVGETIVRGRWMVTALEPGYSLVLGECGGKILYHAPGAKLPEKYHLWLAFEDGSSLTATTQMWGAMELYETGKELERQYIKDMRLIPLDPGFSFEYFSALLDSLSGEKRSAKSLLTQDQIIPGLGNAIAQDILFWARLHPRHDIRELSPARRRDLYDAIISTMAAVIEQGGRYDETDLFGNPGGYVRIMDNNAVGKPCPECGHMVEKIQYLGGACYFCAKCQQ